MLCKCTKVRIFWIFEAMTACTQGSNWQRTLVLFSQCQTLRTAPDTVTWSRETHPMSDSREHGKALQNMACYHVTQLSCIALHDFANCLATLNSKVTYNAAISCCESSGHWLLAVHLFSEMLKALAKWICSSSWLAVDSNLAVSVSLCSRFQRNAGGVASYNSDLQCSNCSL